MHSAVITLLLVLIYFISSVLFHKKYKSVYNSNNYGLAYLYGLYISYILLPIFFIIIYIDATNTSILIQNICATSQKIFGLSIVYYFAFMNNPKYNENNSIHDSINVKATLTPAVATSVCNILFCNKYITILDFVIAAYLSIKGISAIKQIKSLTQK